MGCPIRFRSDLRPIHSVSGPSRPSQNLHSPRPSPGKVHMELNGLTALVTQCVANGGPGQAFRVVISDAVRRKALANCIDGQEDLRPCEVCHPLERMLQNS